MISFETPILRERGVIALAQGGASAADECRH